LQGIYISLLYVTYLTLKKTAEMCLNIIIILA
jgi:hypothetical protein